MNRQEKAGFAILVGAVTITLLTLAIWTSEATLGAKFLLEAIVVVLIGMVPLVWKA